jgi:microtubule-associated serine/threonine kinase
VYDQAVERNSPAMDAGLCAGDLITHVNGTSVQGLLHIELVRLILTGGSSVTLCTVPLANTSIRIGTRKLTGNVAGGIGYSGMSQACTLPCRHRRRPNDDRRRRSSLFRQLSNRKAAEQQLTATSSPLSPHRLSLSSNDSIPNSPTTGVPQSRLQPNVVAAVESWMSDSAHSTGNSSSQSSSPGSSAPGSPAVAGSPSPMAVGGRPELASWIEAQAGGDEGQRRESA